MEVEKPVYIEKIVQVRACDALSVSRCRFAFQTSLHKGGHGCECQLFGACIRAKHGRLSGLHLSVVSIVKEYTRQHLKPALLQVPVEHVIEKVVTREVPVEVCVFFV